MLQQFTKDDTGPVITGGANFYGGPLNQAIAPAPTGLTGTSTPSVPGVTQVTVQPPILLYPPPGPNIAPPAPPPGTGPTVPPVSSQPASSPCGGCGKAGTPAAPAAPAPTTAAVRLADGVTLGAPAPETAAQAGAPFPWWWLLAAAVVGYAARGKGRR